MSEDTPCDGWQHVGCLDLLDALGDPDFDGAVPIAADAFAQARFVRRHLQKAVMPRLAGRERKRAQLLLGTIRRDGIVQENFLDDLEDIIHDLEPMIEAGTTEIRVWYTDADGGSDSCRIEAPRSEEAEALHPARTAIEELGRLVAQTLYCIHAREAVAGARRTAMARRDAMLQRPVVLPDRI